MVEEALPDLGDGVSVCVVDHTSAAGGFITLSDKLEQVSEAALEPAPRVDLHTDFLIIFTSGTTGTAAAWLLHASSANISQHGPRTQPLPGIIVLFQVETVVEEVLVHVQAEQSQLKPVIQGTLVH